MSDYSRNERFARRKRAELIAMLGGKCVKCGTTERLEFDHYPDAAEWEVSKVGSAHRMRLYERDAKAGKLRLLCKTHNASDGGSRRWTNYHIQYGRRRDFGYSGALDG